MNTFPTPPTELERSFVKAAGQFWWLFLVQGLLGLIIGLCLAIVPGRTLLSIALLFGIYLMIWGVIQVAAAFLIHEDRGLHAMLGLLGIVAGVIVVGNEARTIAFLTLAFGIYLIVWGVFSAFSAIDERPGRALRLIEGLLGIAAGVIVIALPGPSLLTLALVWGFFLIFFGMLEIFGSFNLRSAAKRP